MSRPLPKLEEMKDILDLKGIQIWDYTLWFWVLGGLLLLTIILSLTYFWLKRRLRQKETAPPPTPIQRALTQLEDLLKSDLLNTGNVRGFYFLLSEIFRNFLEEEIKILANEATLEELKPLLKNCPDFTQDELAEAFWFLEISDMAKFAKFHPENPEISKSVQSCRSLMETLARRRALPEDEGNTPSPAKELKEGVGP